MLAATALFGGSASPAVAVPAGPELQAQTAAKPKYKPRFKGSWRIRGGTPGQRSKVRRVIRRLRFPHKFFAGRFITIRFGRKPGGPEGSRGAFAAPRKGYVLIQLAPGFSDALAAHEIGHGVEMTLLGESTFNRYGALVRRYARSGDCLNPRSKPRPEWSGVHACSYQEEFASGFARAFCCADRWMGIEGTRLSRGRFRAFARRYFRPASNYVTTQSIGRESEVIPCWDDETETVERVERSSCRSPDVPNPTIVTCTYADPFDGTPVTRRLEKAFCERMQRPARD